MRVAACLLVLFLVGCATPVEHEVLGTFFPGQELPEAKRLPRDTTLVLPDGRAYILGDDSFILSENHWTYIWEALKHFVEQCDIMRRMLANELVVPETYRADYRDF